MHKPDYDYPSAGNSGRKSLLYEGRRVGSSEERTNPSARKRRSFVWHNGLDFPASPKIGWIAYPIASEGARTLCVGDPKVGKTTYLVSLAAQVIQGRDFFGRPTKQMPVVYLTEQTPAIFGTQVHPGCRLKGDDFHYLSFSENYGMSWTEFIHEGVDNAVAVGSKLLVVDTVGKFAQMEADQANSDGRVRAVLDVLDYATSKGIAQILAKHSRKSGGDANKAAAGSYAWNADVDIIAYLTHEKTLGNHQRKLETSGRLADGLGEWLCEYDPLTRGVTAVGDYEDSKSKNVLSELLASTTVGQEYHLSDLADETGCTTDAVRMAIKRDPNNRFAKIAHGVYKRLA